MSLWIIVPIVLYILGFLLFMTMVAIEAPKQNARIGALHVIVALGWPFWGLWYLWIRASEWYNSRGGLTR